MARNRAYRELLTGLDDEAAGSVGDSIETLSQVDVTPAAWQRGTGDRAEAVRTRDRARRRSELPARPSLGAGPRRCGGSWRLNLAPTPELLARVEALPTGPRRRSRPDLAHETQGRPGLLDVAARQGVPLVVRPRARPRRPRRAGRPGRPLPRAHRRRPRRQGRRGPRAVVGLGGVPAHRPGRPLRPDRLDVRHRPHQRADHGRPAHPHLGPAPAALARLLRARDGRPDHDPDDHRRRPVRDPDRERPPPGPRLPGHLRRRRRRAAADGPRARALDADGGRPARVRDGDLPARHQPSLRRRPRGAGRGQRRLPGVAVGHPRGAGVRPRAAHPRAVPPARPASTTTDAPAPSARSRRTSPSCCSSPRSPTSSCSASAPT